MRSWTISFCEPVQPTGSQLATCLAGKAVIGRTVALRLLTNILTKIQFRMERLLPNGVPTRFPLGKVIGVFTKEYQGTCPTKDPHSVTKPVAKPQRFTVKLRYRKLTFRVPVF
ncbi:hypothetical protein [Roseibium algicola]|uniref:hypothetical protein n=1 Tax=Roseibium algicola TaxID=2857014 RepID=UPI0012EC4B7B|nr:hypothetical protein [Roseibium aggregatum]